MLIVLTDAIEEETFQTWLPKRIANQFKENQVCEIHSFSEKLSMTYMMQSRVNFLGSNKRSVVPLNLIE